jgi:hypothetical protein
VCIEPQVSDSCTSVTSGSMRRIYMPGHRRQKKEGYNDATSVKRVENRVLNSVSMVDA